MINPLNSAHPTCKSKNMLYRRNMLYWLSSAHLTFNAYSYKETGKNMQHVKISLPEMSFPSHWNYRDEMTVELQEKQAKIARENHTHIILPRGIFGPSFFNVDHFHLHNSRFVVGGWLSHRGRFGLFLLFLDVSLFKVVYTPARRPHSFRATVQRRSCVRVVWP